MSLKTNYKNDIFSGNRKYNLISNTDGTVSLEDVTEYQQAGDIFNADDINATNIKVNEIETNQNKTQTDIENTNGVIDVTVPVSNWSLSAPYTQTISIPDLKDSRPVIGQHYIGIINQSNINAQDKARNCVERIVANNGSITLYCYNQKPQIDFGISIKGGKYG